MLVNIGRNTNDNFYVFMLQHVPPVLPQLMHTWAIMTGHALGEILAALSLSVCYLFMMEDTVFTHAAVNFVVMDFHVSLDHLQEFVRHHQDGVGAL